MSIGSTPWLHKNSVAVTKNYYAIKSLTFWGHIKFVFLNSPFCVIMFFSDSLLNTIYKVDTGIIIFKKEAAAKSHNLLMKRGTICIRIH